MKVKMILPALTEATSPFWRPIKYSLFPPLGPCHARRVSADVEIQDEHVERLDLDDTPDLVVIQVYITSAHRAYLGGLHVTSLPDEAAAHANTIFVGPGEDTWPRLLADLRRGCPERMYRSQVRTLAGLPPIRRDLTDQGRLTVHDWDLYDTRHTVFRPPACRPTSSKAGTAGHTVSSIAGHRSSAAPPHTRISSPACAIWHTRRAGRSSSRCGIS